MGEIISGAWRRLRRRRSRTALTVGGILVGVMMVALVSVIADAGTAAVGRELENMGLRGVSLSAKGAGAGLSAGDLAAVREVNGVAAAMPLTLCSGQGRLGHCEFSAYIGGIDAGASQVIKLETAHGRLFHRGDVHTAAPVCVVDESVAKAAYGRSNVVGKTLTLTVGEATARFEIIGVAKVGSSLLQGVSGYLPGLVYLPYTTLQNFSGRDDFSQIAVQLDEAASPDTVRARMLSTLERENGAPGGYSAENLAAQRERLGTLMTIVTLVLTAVSAVSLLVAGMGMLTSMLTAVHERVREIGIKRALGATSGRILAEFLTEAVVLSAVGGALGVALGAAVGALGLRLAGMAVTLPWERFALLWLGSVALGALFGWYPAHAAAALCPVEALRSET